MARRAAFSAPNIDVDQYGKPCLPLDAPALYGFGDLIRRTELLLLDLFTQGVLSGTVHTCIGQELCQMAVVRALGNPRDVVLSNHRNHGHFLTYSGDFHGLVSEVMGRESGVCRGRGGSQHLAYRCFHSSGVQAGLTAIGAGLALAEKKHGGDAIVTCLIGDGTLGEGLVYESLNLASIWRVPILFVVEHNGIAQTTRTADTTAGSLVHRGAAFGLDTWRVDDADPRLFDDVEDIVRTVRSSRQPGFLVIDTMRLGPHSKGDDLRDEAEMSAIRARDPLAALGTRLESGTRAAIERQNEEFLRIVRAAAFAAPDAAPDDGPREEIRSRRSRRPRPIEAAAPDAATVTVRASLNRALHRMLAEDGRVVLLGEDLHDPYGGAFKVTAGLSTAFGGRVISTPISEAAIVGASIGLALAGFRPVAEIMFADFITLAMDQLYNHAVKFAGLSESLRVPVVVRTPSGGRRGYGPTHSQSPEGLATAVPGLTVVYPSHRHDSGVLLERATLDWDTPVVFFEHKLLYGLAQDQSDYEAVVDSSDPASALFPTLVRRHVQPDLTLVAYGGMVDVAERLSHALGREEFGVEIVVPSLLQPLPWRALLDVLINRERVAILEESPRGPGFGAELAATMLEHGFRGRVRRFAPPPIPIPAARSLESAVLPDERNLFGGLASFLGENDR